MLKIKSLAPGIFLCTAIYLVANYCSTYIGQEILSYKKSPISTVLFCILFGVLISNVFKIGDSLQAGINFSVRYILRLGIVLLGIRIGLSDVIEFGAISVPLVVICIISVLLVVGLARKFLNISSEMSYLISIGTSICGASAIVAMGPVIKAKKGEITYAIANITVFGVLGMFLYPYVAELLFQSNQSAIGLFLGTAIHETAQVAASGLIYEQQFSNAKVLEIATITKLVRNTFLLILIPLFAYVYAKSQKGGDYSFKSIFPLFVVGFVLMVFLRTIGDEAVAREILPFPEDKWRDIISFIKLCSGISLSIAMAGLGLATNIKELKSMGYKPFIVGLIAASVVGLVSFITIKLFLEFNIIS